MHPNRIQSNIPRRFQRAFTLIEVILAMAIAAGILMVVLFFYRQSETLRTNLMDEAARASAARMVMERLSQELSAVTSGGSGTFVGASDSLQFVKLDFPQLSAWTNGAAASGTPFCMVTYSLSQSTNAGEAGLLRSEQFLANNAAGVISTNDAMSAASTPSTNNPPSVQAQSTNSPARRNGAVISQIQYLRFRYWDNTNWVDTWSASNIPAGVEVSLGNDPMPTNASPTDASSQDASSQDYPYDVFRRVIYVANHTASPTNGGAGSLAISGEVTQ